MSSEILVTFRDVDTKPMPLDIVKGFFIHLRQAVTPKRRGFVSLDHGSILNQPLPRLTEHNMQRSGRELPARLDAHRRKPCMSPIRLIPETRDGIC